uniref:Uncharacterized protein n=1 Tax=Vitis vinifera TaxID=29760 RepID=A5BH22_VITVI|nr:hypothetical protein VITISV_027763 [Vitis vinifera]
MTMEKKNKKNNNKMMMMMKNRTATRSTARLDRTMHVAILGCPFGEVGAGAVVPAFVLEAGVAGATSCSGGSATSRLCPAPGMEGQSRWHPSSG